LQVPWATADNPEWAPEEPGVDDAEEDSGGAVDWAEQAGAAVTATAPRTAMMRSRFMNPR